MVLPLSAQKLNIRLAAALALPLVCAAGSVLFAQNSAPTLHEGFLHPAPEARPMMRWWWFGPAVEKPELAREMEIMQKAGIGGVEIQSVYAMSVDDPAKGIRNLKYLSPEFLDAVKFTNETGRKLGLRVDLTLGSGWPYGGPDTTLDLAGAKMRIERVPVTAEAAAPKLGEGESYIAAFVVNGSPKVFDAKSAVRFNPTAPIPAGSGERTALYFLLSHTRMMVKRPSAGAEGYVLDHMSRAAIENHLNKVATPLLSAFGDHPPTTAFSDSLEVYGSDWSATLPEEFKKRRGYDLVDRLPELLAGNTTEARSLRHDWGVTLSDMVRENYLEVVDAYAKAHGTSFRSQTYGEPAVTLADEASVAFAEGEGPQWRDFSFTRWTSSANHLFGQNITSAETWTWLHSPAFRATPLDMKVEADRMFLEGVNLLVGHGWPYSPKGAGEPGWSLYAAAVFNQHNPWFAVMNDITGYLQRMSWLLRQGQPANDVAILLPEDDAQADYRPGAVSVTNEMQKHVSHALMSTILDAGYNLDYIDAKSISKLGKVPHRVLILPATERIPLGSYKIVADYVAAGGKVIALGQLPSLAPGLKDAGDSAAIAALSDQLFTSAGHKAVAIDGLQTLPEALHQALAPDMALADKIADVGFLHRTLESSDLYFVVNSSNQPVATHVSFRNSRAVAEAWNPDNGAVLFTAANKAGASYTLNLAPYESRVFVFSNKSAVKPTGEAKPAAERVLADVSNGWSIRFADESKTQTLAAPASWTELEGRKFFSGEATYTKTINLTAAELKANRVALDFGPGLATVDPRPAGASGIRALLEPPLREAAILTVNGKRMGSLWHAPYRVDVTDGLKAGENVIEVHVFNTAINKMAGDGPRDFTALEKQYGKRFVMQDMDNLQPIQSGMTGPVKLIGLER